MKWKNLKLTARDWHSVRSVFRSELAGANSRDQRLEERVVIFRAENFDEAFKKGEDEAKQHAAASPEPIALAHLAAHSIQETELREGKEVWSSVRELDRGDEDCLHRFYKGG